MIELYCVPKKTPYVVLLRKGQKLEDVLKPPSEETKKMIREGVEMFSRINIRHRDTDVHH